MSKRENSAMAMSSSDLDRIETALGIQLPESPPQYVYIGDEDDACPYALDCENGSVTYTDHGDLMEPLAQR